MNRSGQYVKMPDWMPLLPELKCPFCGNNLKELRIRADLCRNVNIAWVCDCEKFKELEILANKK